MIEKEKYQVNTKYNLSVLLHYILYQKKLWITLIVIIFLRELALFYDNIVFKLLIDKGTLLTQGIITQSVFLQFLLIITGSFVAVRMATAILIWFRSKIIRLVEARAMSKLEKDAFRHITNLSYLFHTNKKSGSLISQFTRGVNKTEALMDLTIWQFFPFLFRLLLSLGVIFYFDKLTSVILLITVIIFSIAGVTIANKQKPAQDDANHKEDLLKQNLSDMFQNIDTVKYFGKERRTQSFFNTLSTKLMNARQISWDYFTYFDTVLTLIVGLGMSAILYTTFSSFAKGTITLGSITLIYSAIWKLMPVLFHLLHGYRHFLMANVDVTGLYNVFKEKKTVVDQKQASKLIIKNPTIHYDAVSFSYNKDGQKKQALTNFTVKIPANSKVALVGPSGSGKTTAIRLLYRFFDVEQGKITIDGKDIQTVTQESLRNSMSIVPQEPLLFDNSLYFNIAYANPKATKSQVLAAMKAAQLHKFVQHLPQKELTIVGERGVKLSGGEKQRVSIARALLANKKILVLDEATSALDSETERDIQKSLEKLMKGRTSIIIAHRLSTIMKADIIVVMEHGKIKEIGTHKQLTKKHSGLYKRLWGLQQGGHL